jgi:DNA-binding CsgD family transcriptional regulator
MARRGSTGYQVTVAWNWHPWIASRPQLRSASASANPAAVRPQLPSAASLLGLLESLRCGAFLLDARGKVLSLNTIAHRCLGNGLVLSGGQLRGTDRATDHGLQQIVGAVLGGSHGNTPMSIAIQRRSRLPLVLRAVRLGEDARRTPGHASLLLLALDPELGREPPREILTQAFGLTGTEADVAIGIVAGKTLAEIAADRGIKIGTVRAHTKTLFSKTHTRGQAELTGVLTRLAFLVPRTEGADVAPIGESAADRDQARRNGGRKNGPAPG